MSCLSKEYFMIIDGLYSYITNKIIETLIIPTLRMVLKRFNPFNIFNI